MSPTFSDRGVTPGAKDFRTLVVVMVTVLTLVIVGVGAWSMLQGPKLRDVQIDESSLHQRSGAFVALRSDRAIDSVGIDQVLITPEAPFTLDDDGLSVRLTFDQPLLADTEYRVDISGVRPSGLGQEGSWSTTFTTGGFDFVFLRKLGNTTEIHRAVPGMAGSEVLYSAPGIVSVTPVASIVAVVREVGGERLLELNRPLHRGGRTSGPATRFRDCGSCQRVLGHHSGDHSERHPTGNGVGVWGFGSAGRAQ